MNRKEPRSAEDFVGHIREAIDLIESYTEGLTKQGFLDSRITQDAVIRNFEIIGEASRNLLQKFPEFVAAHPELPVVPAYKIRNALSHGYFNVDLNVVWKTVRDDLPKLRQQLEEVVKSASRPSEATAAAQRWKSQFHSAEQPTLEEQRRKAVENWLKLRETEQSIGPDQAAAEANTKQERQIDNDDEALYLEHQRDQEPEDDPKL